jgi:hypothetical protein
LRLSFVKNEFEGAWDKRHKEKIMRNNSVSVLTGTVLLMALTGPKICLAQEKPKASDKPPIADKLSAHTTILPQPHEKNPSPKATQYWTPAPDDIARLEADLPKLAKAEVIPKQRNHAQENILTYYRQYSGIIQEGKRLIYVRAFHPSDVAQFPDWRTRAIDVRDGGYGYYYVTYDAQTRQFGRFRFGGR